MERQASEVVVLLVDGQRHMRQILTPILRQAGLREIFTTDSAPEAAAVLAELKPELVLLDYDHDPAEAMAFAEAVRTPDMGWNPQVPVILLVHQPDLKTITAAREAGVNDILAKPLTTASVIDRLRRTVLNRRAAEDADYRGPERRRQVRAEPSAGFARMAAE